MDKERLFTIMWTGVVCFASASASAGPLVGYWPFDGNLRDLAGREQEDNHA